MSPSFYAEVEYETDQDGESLKNEIDKNQRSLHELCYQNFKIIAEQAKVEKIKNDLKGFRFYKTEHGEYPSVTTVIEPEYKPFIGEDELAIATSEGNICHARAAHFIKTGEWIDPKKLEGVASDLLLLKGRFLDVWNFPAMLEKYPMKDMKNGYHLINHEHRYGGTHDMTCLYPLGGEKGAELVLTVGDFKRTPDDHKNYTQISAYAKCIEGAKQMMIIPTNPDNAQGFSKPKVSTAIDKYFEVFLDKRATFREVYGI